MFLLLMMEHSIWLSICSNLYLNPLMSDANENPQKQTAMVNAHFRKIIVNIIRMKNN